MKKISLLIFLLMCLSFAVFSFSGCSMLAPSDTDKPGDGEITDEPDEPEEPEVTYVTISLYDKSTNKLIVKIKTESGKAPGESVVKEIKDTVYHGYKYVDWYYTAFGSKTFDPSVAINGDMALYGDRGNLAGENVTWAFDYDTKTLSFEGTGPMFEFLFYEDVPWIQYSKLVENISIDERITTIANCAFYDFDSISTVRIPDAIERIGECAFYDSTVSDINFPLSLKSIELNAFWKCVNLTELNFNTGLKYIGNGAFSECTGVVRVVLTDEIAEFGNSAFYRCTSITTAFYVGTKEQYDDVIFRLDNFWVKQLANTYFISETKPDEAGPYWYYGDNGEIKQWYYTVGFKAPDVIIPFALDYVDAELGVTEENIAFMNSLVHRGYRFAAFTPMDESIASYEVGLVLEHDIRMLGVRGNICGDNMTWRVSRQTLYIDGTGAMWDFATSKDAPWYGRNIVNVVIGSGVEHIGANTFCNLISIVSVDIPANVKSIHKNAFVGCSELKYVYYLGTAEELLAVAGVSELENMLEAVIYSYLAEGSGVGNHWREVKGGMENTARRVAWTIADGSLTVGGDSTLVNYANVTETPWYPDRDSITSVTVRDGANRVGYNSFYEMTNVTYISFPSTVKKIAESSVKGTGYYGNKDNWMGGALYIDKHLIKVDSSAVSGLFKIKDGTLSIAENAFVGCTGITELIFAKETLGIFKDALAPLTSLERIFFTGSETSTWDGIWASGNNLASQGIDDVDIYYYSVNEPTSEGKWWFYTSTVDGVTDIGIW